MCIDKTIKSIVTLFRQHYVFPARARQAADAIEDNVAGGGYDDLDDAALAMALTAQLSEICGDRHLSVRLRSDPGDSPDGIVEKVQKWRDEDQAGNFGIARAERLDGNVGYLDLRGVTNPGYGGNAIAAAMALVEHTYALIIDLRRNGGGSPDGATVWCSYLFPDAATHLNDEFDAETTMTRQYWSLPYLPGARYLDRPVYVLTSRETFSAAEEIAYSLQALGRATIIGQTTRGGAHPSRTFPVTPTLEMTVPFARAVNPITGTNWEGVGVEPDIDVPAAEAFEVAYRRALQTVLSANPAETIASEATTALAHLA
jgi:C-terminal processing protease CtpA/Prc